MEPLNYRRSAPLFDEAFCLVLAIPQSFVFFVALW